MVESSLYSYSLCLGTIIKILTLSDSAHFYSVKYKYILGLTGTLERLDGRHKLLEKYCPVVDRVTVEEAIVFIKKSATVCVGKEVEGV